MKIAKQIYKILVLCTALIFLASCGYTKEKNSDISTALVYDHSMQTDEAKEFTERMQGVKEKSHFQTCEVQHE